MLGFAPNDFAKRTTLRQTHKPIIQHMKPFIQQKITFVKYTLALRSHCFIQSTYVVGRWLYILQMSTSMLVKNLKLFTNRFRNTCNSSTTTEANRFKREALHKQIAFVKYATLP